MWDRGRLRVICGVACLLLAGCSTRLPNFRPRTAGPAEGDAVRIWTERVSLPTYDVLPDPVPRFSATDRLKFYPYAAQQTISDSPRPRIWTLVCLENEYLIVKVMPQMGGRVYTVYDKLSGQDVVYRPKVIKPAAVGIRGAWMCGGIEYNFPDCHTVTTHDEVHWTMRQYLDGSASVLVGDIERISHMAWTVEFRLAPGRACLSDRVNLYNRTPMRQRYFYWTNACVEGNEQTQVIFPFTKVFTGNRRPVVRDWPDHDGQDWSYCRAYEEGTSVGGMGGAEDFFGSYDHGKGVGLAYVSDHRALPARKFWTFGTGAMGRHWGRVISDDNRSYLELQAGPAITSSEFAWLAPYESKTYHETWIPVSRIGPYGSANPDAVARLSAVGNDVTVGVLAVRYFPAARVEMLCGRSVVGSWTVDLAPEWPVLKTVKLEDARDLRVVVRDEHGKVIIEYSPGRYAGDASAPKAVPQQIARRVDASTPAGASQRFELLWMDNQYSQAADTIEKALTRWPDDPQVCFEAGIYRLFQGLPREACRLLSACRSPASQSVGAGKEGSKIVVPAAGPSGLEGKYYLSLAYFQAGDLERAAGLLSEIVKADPKQAEAPTWIRAARILRGRLLLNAGRFHEALDPLLTALRAQPEDAYVAALAAYAAGQDKGAEAAYRVIGRHLPEPDLEPMARLESQIVMGAEDETLQRMLLRDPQVAIDLACDYIGIADWTSAYEVLTGARGEVATSAMTYIMAAWCAEMLNRPAEARLWRDRAAGSTAEFVLPSRTEELATVDDALQRGPHDARGAYYAGLILMRLMRYDEAIQRWQQAIEWRDDNPLVHRCLGMTLARVKRQPDAAIAQLQRAVALGPDEPLYYCDMAGLYGRLGRNEQARDILVQGARAARASERLLAELVSAHLALGEYAEATAVFSQHRFSNSEAHADLGDAYLSAWLGCGLQAVVDGKYEEAVADFDRGLRLPEAPAFDLAEEGPAARIVHFWRGMALRHLSRDEEARRSFGEAAKGLSMEAASRGGYAEMLSTAHSVMALRMLGDAAGYARRVEQVASLAEEWSQYEKSDWGRAMVTFGRTWNRIAQGDTAVDATAMESIAGSSKGDSEWGRLSLLAARALQRCDLTKVPATQVAGR